jgi:hypothetical protein
VRRWSNDDTNAHPPVGLPKNNTKSRTANLCSSRASTRVHAGLKPRGYINTGRTRSNTGPYPKFFSSLLYDSQVTEIVSTCVITDGARIGGAEHTLQSRLGAPTPPVARYLQLA